MVDNFQIPAANQGMDPIDRYLTVLAQTKQYMDENLPRLEQGVDQILSPQAKNKAQYNGFNKQKADAALGTYNGMALFAPNNLKPKVGGNVDYIQGLIASTMTSPFPQSTAAAQVRKIGFASGPDKLNFDRYYAHPQYKKLGWNPYVDNEAIYNANSTWTDDFSRAWDQWGSLAGLGFKQTAQNWDDLFSLNTAGDTKSAREMNRLMSIASSSRGGVGGFVTNQFANSAYTFGVMGEMLAEEAVLWGATALTEGALAAPAIARTGANIKKLFSAGNAAENVADAIKASKTVTEAVPVTTAVNSVQDVSQARKFWNGVAGFINPLSETAETVKNVRTGANGFDKLTNVAKGTKTFGAFFRDMRLMNAALAESRLEGGFVQNEVFNKLIQDWNKNNVVPPDDIAANKMLKQAKDAGVRTTLMNMPAILYSNKIVFDKALNGFKPFRETLDGSLGTMVKRLGGKGKAYEGFIDTANPKTWFTKRNFKRIGNQFKPANIAKGGMRYLSANLTEGLQEVYQEAVSEATTNYFTQKYLNPERAGYLSYTAALGEGFGNQLSGKGAETFLSGFLMGGLVQGPQALAFQYAPQIIKDFQERAKDPVNYKKRQDQRKAQQEKITNFLNRVAEDPKMLFDPVYANLQAQKDFATIMNLSEEDGNKKKHKDASQDSIFEHVQLLLDKGYIDLLKDQIGAFKQLSDEELLQAFGYAQENGNANDYNKSIREKLNGVDRKIEEISKRYEKYASIKNPFDPDSEEFLDYDGFELARKAAIYNEYTFDQAEKRMASILQQTATFAGGAVAGTITNLFNIEQLNSEIKLLQQEAVVLAGGDATQKKLGKEKQKALDALTRLRGSIDLYSLDLEKHRKSLVDKESKTEIAEDVKTNRQLKVGSEVVYTPTKGASVNATVIKRTAKQVVIEYTENGKKVTKRVNISSKLISPKVKQQLELDLDEAVPEYLEYSKKELENDLREYISIITGLPVNDASMDKLVIDFQDYYELEHDKKVAAGNVNRLNDPNFFFKTARRFSASQQETLKVAKQFMEDSYAEFMRRKDTNQLLGDIYDKFRVFVLPEDIADFVSGKKLPKQFVDVATKVPLETDSPRYADIINYLRDFEQAMGYKFENMPEVVEVEETEEEEVTTEEVSLQPEKPIVTKPVTTDMAVVDIPKDLLAQLRAQFRIDNNNMINAGQTAMSETEFAKWLQTSASAANIIYNYNIANNLIDKNTPRPQVSTSTAEVVTEIVKFEDLTPNTLLNMKDTSKFPLSGRARVIETNAADRTVTVKPVGEDEIITFIESEIPNQITSIFKKGVSAPEVTPEVTADEQQLSNENLNAVTTEEELINSINEDVEKAKSMTKEDRDNDLLNSLGCK
jgi:hypothetical protein